MSFIVAAAAMTAGGIASSAIGAGAAGSAADKQAAASNYAANIQKQIFDQQRADQSPWRQGGLQALYGQGGLFTRLPSAGASGNGGGQLQIDWTKNRLDALRAEREREFNVIDAGNQADTDAQRRALMANRSDDVLGKEADSEWGTMGTKETAGQVDPSLYQVDPNLTRSFTLDDFQKDPGYEFRMQEGQKALERSAAASGGLQSGGTLKAATEYGQNFASGEYQNAYNRFTNDQSNRFNRLSAIAGGGQTANAQLGQAGQNYASTVGNIATSNASAQGAAGIAQANAYGGAINSAGQNWMGATMMNRLLPSASSGPSAGQIQQGADAFVKGIGYGA